MDDSVREKTLAYDLEESATPPETPPRQPGRIVVLTADGADPADLAARLATSGRELVLEKLGQATVRGLAARPPSLVLAELADRRALDIVAKLRAALGTFAPPVIGVVAGDQEELFELAFAAGFADVLPSSVPDTLLRVKVARHARDELPEKRRLGPYRLEALLGRGGMGSVFLATRAGQKVAVKLLDCPPGATDVAAVARFRREAEVLRSVRGRCVPRFLDAGRIDDSFYLVMEYVSGEALARRISRGPLDEAAVVRMVGDVAEALSTLHEAGLIHRDVKPANVILTPDGSAKLVDFGLAKPIEDRALTSTDDLLGTLPYLAPELVRGADADPCTDAYALGMTALEALLGRCPFRGSTAAIFSRLSANDVPRASKLLPEATPYLVAALDGLLEPRREDRASVRVARSFLESREGLGAFGAATGAVPMAAPSGTGSVAPDPSRAQPEKCVLVIDDDAPVREAVCDLLNDAGFETIDAASGSDAIERLRTTRTKPDLILLDLRMTGMDGWRFRAWQNLQPSLRSIPVVVMSGLENARGLTDTLGATAVVSKPLSADRVLEVVRASCGV